MSKIMYETCCHYLNRKFWHYTVNPITVLREGAIVFAIDEIGNEFEEPREKLYETEDEAWIAIRGEIKKLIDDRENQVACIEEHIRSLREYLSILDNDEGK